uniref:Heat shock 70 kDa protein n=1 Tax=Philasterides dicentrarchi TaxID=282688 RepID=A0A5J6DUV4_9CILI|nr:heat shock 70 kDa protein [Philasterides dicentrarchi]
MKSCKLQIIKLINLLLNYSILLFFIKYCILQQQQQKYQIKLYICSQKEQIYKSVSDLDSVFFEQFNGYGLVGSFESVSLFFVFFSGGFFVRIQPRQAFIGSLFQVLSVFGGDFSLVFFFVQDGFDDASHLFKFVSGFSFVFSSFISDFHFFGFFNQSFDFFSRQSTFIVNDFNVVGSFSGFFVSGDVQNSIFIQVEGDFDLRFSFFHGRNINQIEFSEQSVVFGHLSFSFVNRDGDLGLSIALGGEDFGFFDGDGGVSGDKGGHDSSFSFDSQTQGGNIDQQDVVDGFVVGAGQDGSLDGGSVSDGFIGVDGFVGFFSVEEILDQLLDFGNSGRSSDQNDILDGVFGDSGVFQDFFDRGHTVFEVLQAQFFEFSSGDGDNEVFRFGQRVDFDGGLGGGGQDSFGSFTLGSQSSQGSGVSSDINSFFLQEVGSTEVDQFLIEIFSSQVGVSGGGFNFEDSFIDGQQGNVESSSSQIEDQNVSFSLSFFVQSVGNSGGGGFVDDSQYVQSGDGSGVFGGQSLRVVEIGGDGNDGVFDGFGQERFSDFFHFNQNHGGDFFGVEFFDFSFEFDDDNGFVIGSGFDFEGPLFHVFLDNSIGEFSSDKSFGIKDGVNGVSGNLVLSGISDQSFSFGEGDIRRSGSVSLVVGNDFNSIVLPNSDTRVSGSQIDSDGGSGGFIVFLRFHLFIIFKYFILLCLFVCLFF